MDSKMNRYFFKVIGDDVANLKKYSPETIRRNVTLGRLIHIPIILWVAIGYLLSSEIIGLGTLQSVLIAMISGLFIYFLDFSVINSPRNRSSLILRLGLGLIISLLGAVIIDVFFFNKDINEEIFQQLNSEINSEYQQKIIALEKDVNKKEKIWFAAQETLQKEIDGKGGSGRSGVGRNALFLKNQADEFKKEVKSAKKDLSALKKELVKKQSDARNFSIKDVGLIEKVNILHKIIFKNQTAMIFYAIFFTLFIALELWLIAFKQFSPKTVDDFSEEVKAKIKIHELKEIMQAHENGYANSLMLIKGDD